MNVLFICKRYYTGKDVIEHNFGRLYEIPKQLALLGHQVSVICLDYRNKDRQRCFTETHGAGVVTWYVAPLYLLFSAVKNSLNHQAPDLVFATADIPCLWLGRFLARWVAVPYIVDLYDNYESFGQARIPGFRRILRSCINQADAVVCVSDALRKKVLNEYQPNGQVVVMNNGIGHNNFYPGDKVAARTALGLPHDMRLIGTAGALTPMKGLEVVYRAWSRLEAVDDNLCLVLAGRVESQFPVPKGARVIYLGELLEGQVGQLFRALDVGIVPALDSEFGRYCFPQKLYEMVACFLPVVAADVGAIADILACSPQMLYPPDRADVLADLILDQLEQRQLSGLKAQGWEGLVKPLGEIFLELSLEKPSK